MLNAVKKRYYQNHIKSRLRKNIAPRTMLNFTDASTIGLLFNASERNEYVQVQTYVESLRKRKKSVKILAFVDSKSANEDNPFPYFSRNDLNWYEVPSSDEVKDFVSIKFDILINLCTISSAPLEYICAVSASTFRIGRYSKDKVYCYDLMINNDKNASISEFIKEVDHFLETINVND